MVNHQRRFPNGAELEPEYPPPMYMLGKIHNSLGVTYHLHHDHLLGHGPNHLFLVHLHRHCNEPFRQDVDLSAAWTL